jgi:bacterioferritin (cytochrome b1)
VLQRILLYGFVIALVLIGLGFGLKYRELSRTEQTSAVHLQQELADNLSVLASLKANTEIMLVVSTAPDPQTLEIFRRANSQYEECFTSQLAQELQALGAVSEVAEVSARSQAEDDHLLGPR